MDPPRTRAQSLAVDTERERRLGELARRQHGVVSSAQLGVLGLPAGAVHRRWRRGLLRRLHRGVYQVGPILPAAGRLMAATLACGPDALVADWSAAELLKLVERPADEMHAVQVLIVGGRGRSRPGISVRRARALDPAERTRVDRIPVTTPARTLLDLAARAGLRELERLVARAEQERLVTRRGLEAALLRGCRHRGAGALRAVLDQAGGPALTVSEAEALFLELIRNAGIDMPETNVRFGDFRLDFLWRTMGIAVEVDGYRYHGSRPRFEADRRRAAQLAARGIHVIPVTWRQIVEEGTATAVRIASALLRAELR